MKGAPRQVVICHCRFCQRSTGSAYLIEPLFDRRSLSVTCGVPRTFDHESAGSGRLVHMHSCGACATTLYLTFDRFPTFCGVYAGTFDDPNWIDVRAANAKHIFVGHGRHDTLLPSGFELFVNHFIGVDGAPLEPVVLERPQLLADARRGFGDDTLTPREG